MLRTIDRYIIRALITPFLISLLVFTFILIVPYLIEQAEQLIAKGVPSSVILRIMLTLVPQALAITIPMALLVSLLIGLGRLSGDREWVALQACGVSMFRILRPVGFVAVLAWAATSYVIIWAVPDANQTFREITYNIVAARTEGEVKPRVFFEDFPNLVLYVRDLPASGHGWSDVFLADTSQPGQPTIYLARSGRMVLDREKRTVALVLEDGTQHMTKADSPETYTVGRFPGQLVLSLDPERVFPRVAPERGDNEKTITELQALIVDSRKKGVSVHNAQMAIQKRFSIPVACLVFALLAVVLGLTDRKDGKLASFVLGIAVIFAYYLIMMAAQSGAKGQVVPGWLAMWLPDLFLGALGVALLFGRAGSAHRRGAFISRIRARVWHARGQSNGQPDAGPAAVRGPAPVRLVIKLPHLWLPRPSLLDGYIVRTHVRVFALTFFGLLSLFYISEFFALSEKLLKGTATPAMLMQYFWYKTPQYVYYCIPLSVLIGALVTIGMLTKNSELIVMRACGISLYRSTVPLLVFAAAASGVIFLDEENVLAYANQRAQSLNQVIRGGSPQTFNVLNRKWMVSRTGEFYNYVYFDPRTRELNGFSAFRFAPKTWRLQSRTFYRTLAFTGRSTGEEPSVTWTGRSGWTRDFDRDTKERAFTLIPSQQVQLEPPQFFVAEQQEADRMTYGQLRRYISELQSAGYNVVSYEVELHRKLSFPWVTVVMTFIAVPFAVMTGRRGALYGIGMGIVIAIVYWTATSVFAAIGSGGLVMPLLAAWAPNVLFGLGAGMLLLTVRT
jgi:LPS export ABC transporter permease LptG/LPS export ABC transporter permease LptF